MGAHDQVADDEQRPPLSEHFRRLRDRAVLAITRHAASLPRATRAVSPFFVLPRRRRRGDAAGNIPREGWTHGYRHHYEDRLGGNREELGRGLCEERGAAR